MLIAALVLGTSGVLQVPSQAGVPISYIVYVSSDRGRCVFQTGDVLFDLPGFKRDLSARFDRRNGIVIYHPAATAAICLRRATKVAKDLGFPNIIVEIAPADLNMGPPIAPPPSGSL